MSYDTPKTADASYAELAFNGLTETSNRLFRHPLVLLVAALATPIIQPPLLTVTYVACVVVMAAESAADRDLIETGPLRRTLNWVRRRTGVDPGRSIEMRERDYVFGLALLAAEVGALIATPSAVAPLVLAGTVAIAIGYVAMVISRRPAGGGERL